MSKASTNQSENQVRGTLSIRTLAMPADTNPNGDIFGGWLMSQMDIAGGITAHSRAGGRVVTVGVEAMTFHRPVHVGDVVCCYTDIVETGKTSMAVLVEVWVLGEQNTENKVKVTAGTFTYVAIGEDGTKRQLPTL
jgi:acyl-CoA thioesterase YciA